MAADASHGAGALGHLGAGVVRAARAKPGLALGQGLHQLQGTLFGIQDRQPGIHARRGVGIHAEFLQALGNSACNQGGRQIGIGAQQGVGSWVGVGPLAATEVTLRLNELTQHMGSHVRAPVVQLFFKLVFDDLALFFHHQDFLQAGGKFAGQLRLQRPDNGHLVQPDAQALAGGVIQAQVQQGLARVIEGLATGDQAEPVVRAFNHIVVKPVSADIGQGGVPLVMEQAGLLLQGVIRPADVQAAGGHLEVGRDSKLDPVRVDHHRGAGLDDFLDGLHASPDTRETAHGKGMQPKVQNLLHAGREKHRRAAGFEDVIALVRSRRAFGDVIITRHRNDAAPRRGAGHVGVFEHVAAPVHARALTVPNAEHAVVFVAARWGKTELLRAPQRGSGQLFIDTGLKHNVVRLQVRLCLDQCLVIAPQRRTTVATDEAGRILAHTLVAQALQHGQLDQRLHAAHEGRAVIKRVFVIQRDRFQGMADVGGQRGIHGG